MGFLYVDLLVWLVAQGWYSKQRTFYWGPETIFPSKQTFADERNKNVKFETFPNFERCLSSFQMETLFCCCWRQIAYNKWHVLVDEIRSLEKWHCLNNFKIKLDFLRNFFSVCKFFSQRQELSFPDPYLKDFSSKGSIPRFISKTSNRSKTTKTTYSLNCNKKSCLKNPAQDLISRVTSFYEQHFVCLTWFFTKIKIWLQIQDGNWIRNFED